MNVAEDSVLGAHENIAELFDALDERITALAGHHGGIPKALNDTGTAKLILRAVEVHMHLMADIAGELRRYTDIIEKDIEENRKPEQSAEPVNEPRNYIGKKS